MSMSATPVARHAAWWTSRLRDTARLVGRELVWSGRGTVRLMVRYPRPSGLLLLVLAVSVLTGFRVVGVAALAMLAVFALWCRLGPVSFARCCAGPLRRWLVRRWMRREWPAIAAGCGLSVHPPVSSPAKSRPWRSSAPVPVVRPAPLVPVLRRLVSDGPRLRLHLELRVGQTLDDVDAAADKLRTAVGASRVRVHLDGPVNAQITFTMGDLLADPFPASVPGAADPVRLDAVVMGRLEDGDAWRLPLGPHTLAVGCSGAGKGSVFWSFAFGLAPAVHAGLVRLYGIDLKGGMEILMGRDLFSMRATNPAQAVAVLEHLVGLLNIRTEALAGHVRSHQPTVDEPLHVVMIDELAALTAYCAERDLRQRGELAINLLCSQGGAPGFVVFACLQDPRKEVIPSRGLFTQTIGLRLKDATETGMVLGEAALLSGAHCHRIPRTAPGTGYVVPEDGGYPIRVRAGYPSDDAIREVSAALPTPHTEPVIIAKTEPDPFQTVRPRSSKPRIPRPGTGGDST
jgi:S-DNA-T family DNA segregation ATPase FtsK/SpoIIIE